MLPRFRRGAFAVFALAFVVTMLLGDRSIGDALGLQPESLLTGGRWWTPLTALFRQPEGLGMLGLLWTLLVQWILGSRLEGFWGTARYLLMILVAGLVAHGAVVGLALALPAVRETVFAGSAPLDAAAVAAFAFVFARERMHLGSRSVSPVAVAGVFGLIVLVFPVLTAVVGGTPAAAAWPLLIPQALAAAVATVFVQPWRKRESSGKVERSRRDASHLRVVRSADDMLN